ncbi:hypothetical protein ACFXG4_23670 [Nocardia sp. NPDC059246]|uniref:hypothetical protein n=1 Tax=unclassified Nocardia TaxID=2637762 RepID=UPI00369EDF5A
MLVGSRRHPATSVVVAYLSPLLSVPVMDHGQSARPDSFVYITRVGGPKKTIVTDGPMITFECWHPVSAEALAMEVLDHIENAPGDFVPYLDDDGNQHRAWISSYEEVGAPAQHRDSSIPNLDRWVFTARLGIATNM